MHSSVFVKVTATPENVAVCRQAFLGLCDALGLDDDAHGDVGLAVTEACANAVLHAYTADARVRPLEVEAFGGDDLKIVVRDAGRGLGSYSPAGGMGMGLGLIAALTRTVSIRTGPGGHGTEVEMHFALPHEASPDDLRARG